jgi:predicted nucleotidyltransferase component of viral defense system
MKNTNISSIRSRLKNFADKEQKPFDFIMMLYFIERLLYRLSISKYCNQFVLKGGLLLYTITDEYARQTKDADFLVKETSNSLDDIKDILVDICNIESADAVTYDAASIACDSVKEDADYEGIRAYVTAYLGNARKKLQLDIGFGDVIVPKSQVMEYPTLLEMDKPIILAYSKESIISEKFETMLYLAEANSRMKDFYDIYSLCINFDFDGGILHEAIVQTLKRRKTSISTHSVVCAETFANNKDKHTQWKAFCKRANVASRLEFVDVMGIVRSFLMPVFEAIAKGHDFIGSWNCSKREWV